MNDLRRELAPITDEAWREIEKTARETLQTALAARKLVDFRGPLGWTTSAVDLGRVQRLSDVPSKGVEARRRLVQPLIEWRVALTLSREELDALSRGAAQVDLAPVVQAALEMARAEDRTVFFGCESAGIAGIASRSAHAPLSLSRDYTEYPRAVSEALELLASAGVGGPYAIALGPECNKGLRSTTGEGGYPVLHHVQRLLDGPVTFAPSIEGAVVLSTRGGDFELVVGRDISIGYLEHDAERVRLYLEESMTFRLISPEAAVPLVYAA
jgi:uncharacterized linocin/CFP29 family protein